MHLRSAIIRYLWRQAPEADIYVTTVYNPYKGYKITLGGLTMDLDNMAAYDSNNEEIHFTPTEFAMLTYLMKNAARAVPRSELLPTVWGFENDSGTRVADDTVKRLRKKLQNTNLSIETIWGYGFKVREK